MDLEWPDRGRGGRGDDRGKASGGVDGARDGAVHAGPGSNGGFLHTGAGQRDATGGGPTADPVGDWGHCGGTTCVEQVARVVQVDV